jgi:chromosome partitioning protein
MIADDKFAEILAQYPEYINKEQMRIICRMSKQTARRLLQSGLIPCEDSGKLTRQYKIKTADVVKYLQDGRKIPEKCRTKAPIVYSDDYTENMREFYIKHFEKYPDVGSISDVVKMTGYDRNTIIRWIHNHNLKIFRKSGAYYIPKITLIDYLVSPNYRGISVKSAKHRNSMRIFHYPCYKIKKQGEMNMCKIFTVANQKGGVGKSTTVLNLGYALAEAGKRVLLIDLDPQGSLTVCFGVDNYEKLTTTMYNLMLNVIEGDPLPPKDEYLMKKDNIDLIPCNISLCAIENKLIGEIGSEKTVSYIISELKNDYDYVILDTSPSLGILTVNAITASSGVIITVTPQLLSAVGLKLLIKTIQKVQNHINPAVTIEGVLMTMCDTRTNLCKEMNDVIEKTYRQTVRIFDTMIPFSTKVGEANMYRKSVLLYDKNCKPSKAYKNFARELITNG